MSETIKTYEELIISRIEKALSALDAEDISSFDRIFENTEPLLKLKPGLFDIYTKWKNYYVSQLQQGYKIVAQKVSRIDDPYTKKIQQSYEESALEWGFRTDMLQKLLDILNNYQLVPFSSPDYAQIETQQETEQTEEQTPVEITPEDQESIEEPPIQNFSPEPPQDDLSKQMERLKKEEAEILRLQQQKPKPQQQTSQKPIKKQFRPPF